MAGHARLSASQTKRWWNCPGSPELIASLPHGDRRGSSRASRLGTAAHCLLSISLGAGTSPRTFMGDKIVVRHDDHGGDARLKYEGCRPIEDLPGDEWFEVDDDMASAVEVAYDYVQRLLEDYPWAELRLDRQCDLSFIGEDMGGTGDIVVDAWPDLLVVLDYKHGAGVMVEVEGNHQCRTYAIAEAHLAGYTHERVLTGIVQPRKPHPDGPVRTEELTMEEMVAWGEELKAARERVKPGALLCPGDWCRESFCDANGRCPGQFAAAQEQASIDFAAEEPYDLPVPTDLPTLAQVAMHLPALKALVKGVERRINEAVLRGELGEEEGWKIVLGRQGDRKWAVPEERVLELMKEAGINNLEEAYEPRKLKSVAQFEKLSKAHKDLVTVEVFSRSPGKPKAVPLSDKGKAISPVDATFEPYEDDDDE